MSYKLLSLQSVVQLPKEIRLETPTPTPAPTKPPTPTKPPAPRWAKVFGTIAAVIILLFLVMLIARGPHRPGMHGGHAPVQQQP